MGNNDQITRCLMSQFHNVLPRVNIARSFKKRSSLESDGGSRFLYGEKVPGSNTIDHLLKKMAIQTTTKSNR